MAKFKGFGELKKPTDLVKKLEFDLDRLKQAKNDQYVAFDFFVTAEHIVDWIHPADKAARKAIRESSPLLKIVSHIANGAKHFEATAAHHQSIDDVKKERYVQTGYIEDGYFDDPIIVRLTSNESAAFGKNEVNVVDLAEQVLTYWKAQSIT